MRKEDVKLGLTLIITSVVVFTIGLVSSGGMNNLGVGLLLILMGIVFFIGLAGLILGLIRKPKK